MRQQTVQRLFVAGFLTIVTTLLAFTMLTAGSSARAVSDPELSGRDIYQRVLRNRFHSFIQESALISGDRAGNDQETRLRMWFQDVRPEAEPAQGDPLSKTLVRYLYPFDIRHSTYLIINRLEQPNDQFVYLPSHRRVRRVNLRGEAVFGTDFSFEDVIPRELEDSEYQRLSDEDYQGKDCYVVAAVPKAEQRSEYSILRIYVEKERFVPLRTRYWDDRDVEVKELEVAVDSIEQIEGRWIPMRMTMRNLRHESFTKMVVRDLQPDAEIERTVFELRRLEAH